MHDLIVLGGGPGGYLAAERAGQAGLNTLLIEKNKVGGVCLNEGCIPSKTLLNSAKVFDHAKNGEHYGVAAENARIDQPAVIARKNKVVKTLVSGVSAALKAAKVTVKNGEGIIQGRSADGVITVQVGDEKFESKRLIVATGSEVVVPPIPGVKEGLANGGVVTSREILDLERIPKTMTVVGGGVIGLEMAGYFAACGCKVSVVEMLDHIAGNADSEMSSLLQKAYEKRGIEFHLGCQVTGVKGGFVEFTNAGKADKVASEVTLMSVGRRAATKGIGLESIGVLTDRGKILTDARGRTNVPGVFAVGDANGVWMLAHAAYREAEVAVNTILGKRDIMRYDAMPSVIYTTPEMAFVGETEETCKAKGIAYRKSVLPMSYSGRFLAETDGSEGKIKLIVDSATNRMIGCHLLGNYASEIILAAGTMIETQMRVEDIKEIIFPHPTVGEIIREAIFHI